MIRVWILGWGQFSCLWNVATRGRCGTQLWLMKIPLNLVGLEGSRLPIRLRLCWVSFDHLWFKKVWIYLFFIIIIIIIILWVFWLVGLIGFAWFCAFMVRMWVFELGGGVQYSCDCIVRLLCSGVGMNCGNVR